MSDAAAGSGAPADIVALARRRAAARSGRDFPAADALRADIAAAGWQVADTADGFSLTAATPYEVVQSTLDLPDRGALPDSRRVSVAVIVAGWPQDVRDFAEALLRFAPADTVLLALDVEYRDGAGDVLHELALAHPGRIADYHVRESAGWAAAVTALARADTAAVHVLADLSTILTGDALTPLLAALEDPTVVGAGWRGVRVSEDWHSFDDAATGEVEALLGYFLALRRSTLLAVPPHPKAHFYRNADLELSYAIRAAGLGRLVVPTTTLPLRQARHRGYHDCDPASRDAQSQRNYARFLSRFRGRDDLRVI